MRARRWRIASAVLTGVLLALLVTEASRAQQNPAAVPTFRSGIDVIALDVVALDRNGEAVEDMTESEFDVYENGVQRPLASFTPVRFTDVSSRPSLGTLEADVSTNTDPEGRLFVIAFDEIANSPDGASFDRINRARNLVSGFVTNALRPNDVAAVVLLGRGLANVGQDFTSSKRRLLQAIQRYSGGFTVEPGSDPTTGSADDLHQEVNRLASLRELVEFLGTLPARRKALLFISESLGTVDVGQVIDGGSRAKTLKAFCAQKLPQSGSNILSCRPSQDLHRTLVAAVRGNVAIYPIDPNGNDGTLRDKDFVDLAAATGGLAITNTNPRPLLEQIARENGAYYRLSIESARTISDGRMVPIKVTTRRSGVTVLSRSGYMARFPDEQIIDTTDTSTLRGALASPISTPGVPMHVSAPVFRSDRGKGLVTVILEFDPRHLLSGVQGTGPAASDLELSLVATDSRRRVYQGGGYRIRMTASGRGSPPTLNAARIIAPMSLDAGRYQLRIAMASQGRTGGVTSDLDVPNFDVPLVLSSLMVTSTRSVPTFWPAGRQPAGPLSWAGTTRREFGRGETISVLGELYVRSPNQQGPLKARAVLRAEGGEYARAEQDIVLTRASRTAGFAMDLPLRNVEPGTYALSVSAGPSHARRPIQEIPIVVH